MEAETLKIIKKNDHIVIDLNVEDQLFERGIDAKGRKLKPPYTPFTKRIKKEKGQPTDRVTLRDAGEFHDDFFVDATSFPVQIMSQDWKEKKLTQKYGIDIFGLNSANRKELSINYIKEDLKEFFKKNL